jgi:hypothetical protein
MSGALKDDGLIALCRQLAADNNGLLLISSRQPVMELDGRPNLLPHKLKPLDAAAGLALFRAAGIIGTDKELAATVEAYNGHALSLRLLAKYLSEYENGDIRQQDTLRGLTDFPEETAESRHAFKVMAAYERQLSGSKDLQILFCLGLFDRPVSAATMSFLRKEGVLDLPNDERVFRAACARLRKQGLLNTVRPEQPQNLDTHPLVRQYFGKRLAELRPESLAAGASPAVRAFQGRSQAAARHAGGDGAAVCGGTARLRIGDAPAGTGGGILAEDIAAG